MSLAARKEGEDIDIQGFRKDDSFNALESKLREGLQSYRDGKIYTLEEAWGEIDQIQGDWMKRHKVYFKPHGTYLIFYFIKNNTVVIIRILKDRMYWQATLSRMKHIKEIDI